ncbi:hypothetical protein [Roseateles flavus]|uniref:WYL domain-containing protein n=1 Tax=Roseateles flavus TaxID=3149041 RepID=A0ABV0GLK9_9BURK
MSTGKIYSASDKSLFDALNQKKVTNADLRELFISRGILVSKETSRRDLAKHFARLFHDYYDYQALARLFGNNNGQRDKLSSLRLKTKATLENFESGAIELRSRLEDSGGAAVKVHTAKGNRLDIEVRYSKTEFNRSEFRQVRTRTALISIYKEGDELVVHAPHSEESHEWISEIVKSVIEKTEEPVDFDEIRLSPTMDAKVKTKFFTHLIRSLPALKLRDVSDVYVTKPKVEKADDDDTDERGSPEIRIDKASLRGQGVLESDELELLQKKGFYVSRIIWTCKEEHDTADVYEFEAQFATPDECSDFTFLPRGFYRYLGHGRYNETRTAFSSDHERTLGRLIEESARATIKNLPGHNA